MLTFNQEKVVRPAVQSNEITAGHLPSEKLHKPTALLWLSMLSFHATRKLQLAYLFNYAPSHVLLNPILKYAHLLQCVNMEYRQGFWPPVVVQ